MRRRYRWWSHTSSRSVPESRSPRRPGRGTPPAFTVPLIVPPCGVEITVAGRSWRRLVRRNGGSSSGPGERTGQPALRAESAACARAPTPKLPELASIAAPIATITKRLIQFTRRTTTLPMTDLTEPNPATRCHQDPGLCCSKPTAHPSNTKQPPCSIPASETAVIAAVPQADLQQAAHPRLPELAAPPAHDFFLRLPLPAPLLPVPIRPSSAR